MAADELIDAIERGAVEDVDEALRGNPSLVSAKTAAGDTLLHIACWQKQLAIVETILAYEPDLNVRGCYGRTPLHYAVHEGRAASVPIVRLLMAHGADPSICDDNGFTVDEWARSEMWEALDTVVELLGSSRSVVGALASREAEPARDDFASVAARVKAIEARGHTVLALSRMLTAFSDGSAWDVKHATHDLPSADIRCLDDAQHFLDALTATTWATPFREWLKEEGTPAHVHRLMDRYERARAHQT